MTLDAGRENFDIPKWKIKHIHIFIYLSVLHLCLRCQIGTSDNGTFSGVQSYEGMEIEKVGSLIHLIRGQRVMLDYDLASLYGVPTHRLNEQVQRNLTRFPPDFMFRLSAEESKILISQIAISSSGWGGRRKWPRAFTREGVAMLSSVLSSPRGVEVNIAIMRAYVKLTSAIMIDASLAVRMEKAELALEGLEAEQGEQAVDIHELFAAFRRLKDDKA